MVGEYFFLRKMFLNILKSIQLKIKMHEEQGNFITTNRMNCLNKRAPKSFEASVEVVKHDHTTHIDRPALKSFFLELQSFFRTSMKFKKSKI